MKTLMSSELHLFILWENASEQKTRILKDLEVRFTLIKVYRITWSQNKFSTNLSRFYGQKLEKNSEKEKHCGTGPFTLLVVRDQHPRYETRKTSRGREMVNANTFDAKSLYRKWTGGGHKVHGTNDPQETAHDLMLLLGRSANEFSQSEVSVWNRKEIHRDTDIIGSDGWESLRELFFVLNETINYVVLRNYECLPNQYHMEGHGDIDLMTESASELAFISNAKKIFREKYRVHYDVPINGEMIKFDFRYCGDNYYDLKWQKQILANKVMHNDIFYIPGNADLYFSLLYHATVHKQEISRDYRDRLQRLAENSGIVSVSADEFTNPNFVKHHLESFLSSHGYRYVEPKDLSVYFNRRYASTVTLSAIRKYREMKSGVESFIRNAFRTSV